MILIGVIFSFRKFFIVEKFYQGKIKNIFKRKKRVSIFQQVIIGKFDFFPEDFDLFLIYIKNRYIVKAFLKFEENRFKRIL
jgi:hypothetical protein